MVDPDRKQSHSVDTATDSHSYQSGTQLDSENIGGKKDEKSTALALEAQKASLEVIRQLITQIITLCTSLIAAGVAFAKFGVKISPFLALPTVSLFVVSVCAGITALMSTTSHLINYENFNVGEDPRVKSSAGVQLISFAFGLLMLTVIVGQLIYTSQVSQ